MMKTDWILRCVTLGFYICLSFGFSTWLPEQFCELIGKDKDSFSSCKWQVFGFRLVFILLYLPLELLALAVVYRHATDMLFKIQLSGVTGKEIELEERQKRSNIAYLMNQDVTLNRRQASFSAYARGANVDESIGLARPGTPSIGDQS